MKEQLYTIPVNDAFDKKCECPVCTMYASLEQNAIDFMMGPSYMEDDIRMETDKIGFCKEHIKKLYKNQNRLGLSLILLTHMNKTIEEVEKLAGKKNSPAAFFKKNKEENKVSAYLSNLEHSCYICNRIDTIFSRYIATIFHLYRTDAAFAAKLFSSQGLCNQHYATLLTEAEKYLSGKELPDFTDQLNTLYLENMKRVRDDLEWFTDKFDFRNAEAPWKNSKDALPRAIQKINHETPDIE